MPELKMNGLLPGITFVDCGDGRLKAYRGDASKLTPFDVARHCFGGTTLSVPFDVSLEVDGSGAISTVIRIEEEEQEAIDPHSHVKPEN